MKYALFLLVVPCAPILNAQSMSESARALVENPALEGARVGLLVTDAGGATLCAHDADKGFMTASNMKLITSAAALTTLGPTFRFRTRLVAAGPMRDGVLDGDLYLVGSGDPSFGGRQEQRPEAVFERLVDEMIERHSLARITGNVIGDDDCQPDEVMGEGWSWGYQGETYAAQVSGLCFAENCLTMTFRATAEGTAPNVSLVPETSYFRIVQNRTVCRGDLAKSTIWARRRRASNDLTLGGSQRLAEAELQRGVSVENPCAFAAHVLHETLRRKGVQVDGQPLDRDELPDRIDRYGDERVLAEHISPPLSELMVVLNKVSQNLYAEQLIRAASRAATGGAGMRDAAAHAKSVLDRLGVDTTGMRIADGSGLTRLDLVRPAQFVALLRAMWHGEHRDLFYDSLPVAGVNGTLQDRFADSPARGVVRAKTGYISSVVALSGYVPRDANREPLVFSILVNNFTCPNDRAKAAVDRFVEAIVAKAR